MIGHGTEQSQLRTTKQGAQFHGTEPHAIYLYLCFNPPIKWPLAFRVTKQLPSELRLAIADRDCCSMTNRLSGLCEITVVSLNIHNSRGLQNYNGKNFGLDMPVKATVLVEY